MAGVDTKGDAEQTVAGQRFGLLRRPERPVHLSVTVALVLFALFGLLADSGQRPNAWTRQP